MAAAVDGGLQEGQGDERTCFVMAKFIHKGSGAGDFVLEGNAQQGELNAAELAGVKIEFADE